MNTNGAAKKAPINAANSAIVTKHNKIMRAKGVMIPIQKPMLMVVNRKRMGLRIAGSALIK